MELDLDQVASISTVLDNSQIMYVKQQYTLLNKKEKTEDLLVMIQWYFKKYPKYDSYVIHLLHETPQVPVDNCCPDCYEPVDYTMLNCKACGQHLDWSTTP